MNSEIIKQLGKNLLLLFVCSVGVVIVLVREFNHGLLSPNRLQIATFILAIGMSASAVVIILKFAKKYRGLSKSANEVPQNIRPHERGIRGTRVAQLCIIILLILLFSGLHGIRKETLLPTFVGVVINLSIIALLARWVMRRKKNVN
jgi:hypothetical protein